MARDHAPDVHPVDAEVGGDANPSNLGLELTTDDIDDIALSPHIPANDRRLQLIDIRNELAARASSDGGTDMRTLLAYVNDRIRAFDNPAEAEGALESVAMDTTSRRDDDDPADSMS